MKKAPIKFGIADKAHIKGGRNRIERWDNLVNEAESLKSRILILEESIMIDDDWYEYIEDMDQMRKRYRKLMVSICRKNGHYIIDLCIISERNIKAFENRLNIAWEESFDNADEWTDKDNNDLRRMLARYNCMVSQFFAFKNALEVVFP